MKRFPQAIKAVKHLSAADPKLAAIIKKVGPLKIKLNTNETLFESLASSIVYQQLHGKAAATILSRFVRLCGRESRFPAPEDVLKFTDDQLRSVGLSKGKLAAIKDLALKVSEKKIPDRPSTLSMSDDEVIEALVQVRGIGVWTAQMLLIFTLGRTDVLPLGDYGVRKAFGVIYGKKKFPSAQALEKHGKKWKPFRSAAAWYLWQALELEAYKTARLKK